MGTVCKDIKLAKGREREREDSDSERHTTEKGSEESRFIPFQLHFHWYPSQRPKEVPLGH